MRQLTKHKVYEFGDKESNLLALQACRDVAARSITNIRSHAGEILQD